MRPETHAEQSNSFGRETAIPETNCMDATTGSDLLVELQKSASEAFSNAEAYIRANPITAAVGIGAAGALIALAVTSRRARAQPVDNRLMQEFNRHSADVVRAIRRGANTAANSETANAIEAFVTQLANRVSKLPDTVSKQASELTK